MLGNDENKRLPRLTLRLPRMTRTRAFAGIGCLLAGAIGVNAMLFQTEKHPAPMFRQLAKPVPVASALPKPPLRPEIREAAPAKEKPALREPEVSDIVLTDIQTELGRRGFYKGEADGKPGPGTTKAIRDFQTAQRLPVDGVASEELLTTIRSVRHTMKDELLDLVKRAGTPEKAGVAALAAGAVGGAALVAASRTKAEAPKTNTGKSAGAKPAPSRLASAKIATTRKVDSTAAPKKQAALNKGAPGADKGATAKSTPPKLAATKAVATKTTVAKTTPAKVATPKAPAPAKVATSPIAPRKHEAGFDSRPVPPLPVAEARDLRARR